MRNHYDEASVVRSLNRKGSVSFSRNYSGNNIIHVSREANDVGIRSWGKIDYLTNYCGYILHRDNNGKKKVYDEPSSTGNLEKSNVVKHSKRDKVNLTSMVKNIMKPSKKK